MNYRTTLLGRSFVVYYGRGPLAGLETYDIAVLEPEGWTTPHHRRLQQEGVTTLAYLSLLEVPPWRAADANLADGDFVILNGDRFVKRPFDNWIADPRSRVWQQWITNSVQSLYRQGWDGLFIDTLGDVEDEELRALQGWLIPAAAELVHRVRRVFPDRPIVVNNGLWRMVPVIAPLIDGVCWEGDLTPEQLKEPWAQAILEFLGRGAQERGWTNMMLTHIPGTSFSSTQRLFKFSEDADRYGFLSYATPANYAEAIRLIDGRIVAP